MAAPLFYFGCKEIGLFVFYTPFFPLQYTKRKVKLISASKLVGRMFLLHIFKKKKMDSWKFGLEHYYVKACQVATSITSSKQVG
jgi:hypothetical protein